MIAILDYGLGNIRAFFNMYSRLQIPVRMASLPADLEAVTGVILPGVGAFDWAMDRLNRSGLRAPLEEAVLHRRVPVLGVCVGMQMLGHASEEGKLPGLGWIDGTVRKMEVSDRLPLPHMGWNAVRPSKEEGLFKGLANSSFYFLHSYSFSAAHPEDVLAQSSFGQDFASAVGRENIFGVQFHPEKSHRFGIRLLQNFAQQSC